MPLDLTTVARVASRVKPGATSLGTAEDTLVGQLVAEVSAAMERYCGRTFTAGSVTQYFDVEDGQRDFPLDAYPMTAITSANYDPDRTFAAATDLDAEEYVAPTLTGSSLFHVKGGLPAARSALKLVYTGGLAANTAAVVSNQAGLANACEKQVVHEYQRRLGMGTLSRGGDKGTDSIIQGTPFLPDVMLMLDQYRRFGLV